jgi:hypothetical protein
MQAGDTLRWRHCRIGQVAQPALLELPLAEPAARDEHRTSLVSDLRLRRRVESTAHVLYHLLAHRIRVFPAQWYRSLSTAVPCCALLQQGRQAV